MGDNSIDIEDESIEFVPDDGSGNEEEQEPTVDELKAKLDETAAALVQANQLNEELKGKVNNTDAIITGFEKAASKLTKPNEVPPPEEELNRETLKEEFYDDPVTSSEKLLKSLFDKKANRLQEDIVRVHLSNSKMRVPDDLKSLAKGYEDEVEGIIKATPPDLLIQYPHPYEEAYKRVIANHVTEVLKNVKGNGNEPAQSVVKEKPFTEVNSVAPPGKVKKRTIKLTPEMIAYGDMMVKKGIDRHEALRRKYGYYGN